MGQIELMKENNLKFENINYDIEIYYRRKNKIFFYVLNQKGVRTGRGNFIVNGYDDKRLKEEFKRGEVYSADLKEK